jgi:hypothetical protein
MLIGFFNRQMPLDGSAEGAKNRPQQEFPNHQIAAKLIEGAYRRPIGYCSPTREADDSANCAVGKHDHELHSCIVFRQGPVPLQYSPGEADWPYYH